MYLKAYVYVSVCVCSWGKLLIKLSEDVIVGDCLK